MTVRHGPRDFDLQDGTLDGWRNANGDVDLHAPDPSLVQMVQGAPGFPAGTWVRRHLVKPGAVIPGWTDDGSRDRIEITDPTYHFDEGDDSWFGFDFVLPDDYVPRGGSWSCLFNLHHGGLPSLGSIGQVPFWVIVRDLDRVGPAGWDLSVGMTSGVQTAAAPEPNPQTFSLQKPVKLGVRHRLVTHFVSSAKGSIGSSPGLVEVWLDGQAKFSVQRPTLMSEPSGAHAINYPKAGYQRGPGETSTYFVYECGFNVKATRAEVEAYLDAALGGPAPVTPPPPPPVVKPAVTVSGVAAGATVAPDALITVTPGAGQKVAKVEFAVDNSGAFATVTRPPFEARLPGLSEGAHTVGVAVTDDKGAVDWKDFQYPVTIAKPPAPLPPPVPVDVAAALASVVSAAAHLRASSGYKAARKQNKSDAAFAKTAVGQAEADLVSAAAKLGGHA